MLHACTARNVELATRECITREQYSRYVLQAKEACNTRVYSSRAILACTALEQYNRRSHLCYNFYNFYFFGALATLPQRTCIIQYVAPT